MRDGHDYAAEQLGEDAAVSAVNWSEVLRKISAHGGDADRIGDMLQAMGLRIEPLGAEDARRTALLYPHTREAGLSLGDRACLALAARLGHVAITADRAWKNIDGLTLEGDMVRIDLIRG